MGVRDVYYSRRHRLGFLSRSLSPRLRLDFFSALDFFFSAAAAFSLKENCRHCCRHCYSGHCVGRCYPPAPTCLHGGYDVAALALFPALGAHAVEASTDF